jgi:hypothetical protein
MTNFPFITNSLSVTLGSFAGMLRTFSTTPILNQDGRDTVYNIAGSSVSVADIRGMKPEARTVAHWRVIVDWDLQGQRPYVIVDPYDPRGLLYLSRGEYLLQSRVSLANDLTLMVVARPGDHPPVPSSKIPPLSVGRQSSTSFFHNRSNRLAWKDFVRLRRFTISNVKVRGGMVIVSPESIERAVIVWARQLFHYSGVTAPERRLPGLYNLARTLRKTLLCNGAPILLKRLKIALFAVYSYLGGNPLKTTEALGLRVRLSNGLPSMIPASHRKLIRDGNLMWIRIWVSILNIYRAFGVKSPDPETAYKTIRKPLPQFYPNFEKFEYFARYVFPRLVRQQARSNGRAIGQFSYSTKLGEIIRSAGANLKSSTSLFSIILDAKAWMSRPSSTNHVLNWFKLHGDATTAAFMKAISLEHHFPEDGELYDRMIELYPAPPFKNKEERKEWETTRRDPLLRSVKESGSLSGYIPESWKVANEVKNAMRPILGRLFNFLAPGGKLRTVAICDYWTQLAMKPVHEYLFTILKGLGANDATFDQQGRVDEYWARNLKPHWSFDLSAATDSIPITLYIHVLAPFFAEEDNYESGYAKALLWSKIMTDRDFGIPSPKKKEIGYTGSRQFRSIRYGTGQPMGAYSSWASMALVHHALVQYSYWLKDMEQATNASWFDTYLVLGDDVDLAKDPTVASNYQLACADFQVKIGLAKSLSSLSNFFEFANQRLCESGNISPLSFLEELSSQTWNSRVEFASKISKRFGIDMSSTTLIRLVTTARQWQGLIPEYSGLRDAIYTRFLKFILLGPLQPYWHSTIELNIDTVTRWLQLLTDLLKPVLQSHEDRERISQLLGKAVLDKTLAALERIESRLAPSQDHSIALKQLNFPLIIRGSATHGVSFPSPLITFSGALDFKPNPLLMVDIPSMRSIYRPDDLHINFIEAISSLGLTSQEIHLIRTQFNDFVTDSIGVPALCPVSYLYMFHCANKHNDSVREQMQELKLEYERLLKEWSGRDVPAQLFKLLVGDKPHPLPAIITLYSKVSAIPLVIRLDEGVTTQNLGVKPPVRPQDIACELLNEVIPLMAQWTGLAVTNLPVLPAGGRRLTPKTLRNSLAFFKRVTEEAGKVKMSVFR